MPRNPLRHVKRTGPRGRSPKPWAARSDATPEVVMRRILATPPDPEVRERRRHG